MHQNDKYLRENILFLFNCTKYRLTTCRQPYYVGCHFFGNSVRVLIMPPEKHIRTYSIQVLIVQTTVLEKCSWPPALMS